ncbi:MAG: hypothetical protein CMO66_07445 [Verrucomicrobiales bacterium]|nr:hypothetical protein [Verrucomicrobiales bacterium]
MGTITKVMLGLIIAAGGGGIFMALSMIPSKVEELKEAKANATREASAYKGQISSLEGAKKTVADNLTKAEGERDQYKTQLDTALQGEAGAKTLIDQANQAKVATETKYAQLKSKYDADQPKLNQLGKAQTDLKKYKDLSFKGVTVSANQIQAYLDELEALKKKKVVKKPKVVTPTRKTKGVVKNVDPKYGYITIDIGDAKKGDVFRVTRGGKFIGKITVTTLRGGSSYCMVDKTQTIGLDKNPKTGDIMIGDDAELSK